MKSDLGILNTEPWTIMSDKQKGLIKGVRQDFLDAEHKHYVRHIWQNFLQTHKGDILKNQLWKCARSTKQELWAASMEEMKVISLEAYKWLEQLPPSTWVRGFQRDLVKCDILLNNNCEVSKNIFLMPGRCISYQ